MFSLSRSIPFKINYHKIRQLLTLFNNNPILDSYSQLISNRQQFYSYTSRRTFPLHLKPQNASCATFIRSNILRAFSPPCVVMPTRSYAKGKDKTGKGGKSVSRVHVSPEEMNQLVNSKRLLHEMEAALNQLREDLVKAVAVRTNVGSLEVLPVELEGDIYPLNELAQVHRKSPQLVVINCSAFPQATKNIIDAIASSGMNLNPQQEGTTLAVPLPKVTREHREALVGKAKMLCNKTKEAIRLVHNTYVRKVKAKADASQDLIFRVTAKIKEYQDDHVRQAETMLSTKQAELLKS